MTDLGMIAGKVTGSPKRKNESTIFSHLNDAYDRDAPKRKEVPQISKPSYVTNNLSSSVSKFGSNPLIA
jgi:hypothetical protein